MLNQIPWTLESQHFVNYYAYLNSTSSIVTNTIEQNNQGLIVRLNQGLIVRLNFEQQGLITKIITQ